MPLTRRTFIAASSVATGLAMKSVAKDHSKKGHVVLLGDSILDNKPYVGNDPCVIEQIQAELGSDWDATLLAVDGSTTNDIYDQIKGIPSSATHLILSSGGNDALGSQLVLQERAEFIYKGLLRLYGIQLRFGKEYRAVLKTAIAKVPKLTVCLIYDPNFQDGVQQQVSIAGLSHFNDTITRLAFGLGLPVIDLRLLFNDKADYANPIEPSAKGGMKIAQLVSKIVNHHDFGLKHSIVYQQATGDSKS